MLKKITKAVCLLSALSFLSIPASVMSYEQPISGKTVQWVQGGDNVLSASGVIAKGGKGGNGGNGGSGSNGGNGPGNGTGNGGNGPKDGSGNGRKTGTCPNT